MAPTIPPPRDSHSHANPNPDPAKKAPEGISPLVDQPLFGTPFTPTPTLPVTGIRCPYDGVAATGDLAPNPNVVGGSFAPDLPLPPNWVVSPFANAAVGGLGQWLLIRSTVCTHRTLWNVSRLAELSATTSPWVPII